MILLVAHLAVEIVGTDFAELRHLKTGTSPDQQAEAALDLIGRLINERSSDFIVQVNENIGPKDRDTFQLSSTVDGKIQIVGTSGVAASMGFYHYLKYYCNGQRTWAGQQTQLPTTLPVISTPITITTNDKFRYYQNVCTVSYSMAFWQWDRWEQEIDWMALHGINLPLAFIGQEAIFQRVYMNLGFTQADLDEYFAGPAFLAWGRMGNIHGWGGPLPQMWITNKLVLQHKILDRMRSLGMVPVLPAFAGHVPSAITRVFPQANVTQLPKWSHFNATYTQNYLLNFQDPLFKEIGKQVIEAITDEFGTDHIYNCDTFNEMDPASSDPQYLSDAGSAVFDAMVAGDAQAIWLMQGWLFLHSTFWQPPQVKALVTSVPIGRMIILDLASDTNPIYENYESYYGQPFIWCMLHNYGGTDELYGAVDSINKGPFIARAFPNSTMIGIGLTPEGINQNEVIYEFMMENSWRNQSRDVDEWVELFAQQRYGYSSAPVVSAWKTLMRSVYNATDAHRDHNTILTFMRPNTHYNIPQDMWYNPEDLFEAWDNFLLSSHDLEGSQLFNYDITDVTRNSLQIVALSYYTNMIAAFKSKNTSIIQQAGTNITNLLADVDRLLASNDRFLVGQWIADAKSWATDANETKLLEYNARNQITLWGPNGEIHDYASKQWAGVTADYYKPRWEFFTQWLVQLVNNGTKWNTEAFGAQILPAVETPWTLQTNLYPTETTGNPILIAQELHDKYRPVTKDPFFTKLRQTRRKLPTRKGHNLYYRSNGN
jgi:alpha-N-acetylglucosaminidase